MGKRANVSKRCGCRGPDGKQLGQSCPRLSSATHGSWQYVLDLPRSPGEGSGRRQVKQGGFASQREAAESLEARRQNGDGHLRGQSGTTGDYLTSWLAGQRQLRATTRRSYDGHMRLYLLPHLGLVPLDGLSRDHIEAMLGALTDGAGARGRRISPATLQRVHATLRAALNQAVRDGLLVRNVATHVRLPPVHRPRVVPWSADELGRFLDAVAGDRLSALYEILAFQGLRRGEALGLRWEDLDLASGSLAVRQQVVDNGGALLIVPAPKTRSGIRSLELGDGQVAALRRHRLAQQTEQQEAGPAWTHQDLVFCREDGRPLRPEYVTRHLQATAGAAGLPRRRLHDLRHGTASMLLSQGVSPPSVSKLLGHGSVTVTADFYAHLMPGEGRRATDLISSLVPRRVR